MTGAASAPRSERRLRTLFFGSGPFAIPILDAVCSMPAVKLIAVVSVPDRPAGRGRQLASPPLVEVARGLGLLVLQPPSLHDAAALDALRAQRPDLAVLADYGRLVPRDVLGVPARGFLNLHPSLLPRHRGATPIAATILDGDAEAGVTLFEMDAGLDTGPVVSLERWPLRGDETGPDLEAVAARHAAALLRESLPGWLDGRLRAKPQDEARATLTRPLRREDGRLDPARTAIDLARRVRALQPWPGTFLETDAGRLAVLAAEVTPAGPGADRRAADGVAEPASLDEPGRLIADGRGLALATAAGRLRLLRVRPTGGRAMTAEDLVRGRPALVGSTVRLVG